MSHAIKIKTARTQDYMETNPAQHTIIRLLKTQLRNPSFAKKWWSQFKHYARYESRNWTI